MFHKGWRSDLLSRSWNRIYANFQLAKDNFLISIQPWYRLPEDDAGDDNPDIDKFMGYGNYRLTYKNDGHFYSVLLRNNFRSGDNKAGSDSVQQESTYSFALYSEVYCLRRNTS